MIKIKITKNDDKIKLSRKENIITITEDSNIVKSYDIFEKLFKVDTFDEGFEIEEICEKDLSTDKLETYYSDILKLIKSIIEDVNKLSRDEVNQE